MSIRILMVTPGFPPDAGGIENVVLRVSEGLINKGHEVHILTTTRNKKDVGAGLFQGISVERLHAFSPGNSYSFSIKIGRRIRKIAKDFDIIHAHGYHALPALNAYRNRSGVKFILSTYYHRFSDSWFRNLLLYPYRLIARKMVNNADIVICISKAEKNLLDLDFQPKDCRVIHVGTDIGESYHSSIKSGNVVMIGRLERYKNVHIGIQAVSEIGDLSMDIVGSGPEMKSLKNLVIEKGVEDRIRFHGFLSDSEKNQILAESPCLLTLSDYESFGIVIIEAARSGVSVIASEIPSHKEIAEVLEGGVYLVDQSDIEKVSELVKLVIRTGNSSNNTKVEKFGWEYLVDRYIDAYESVFPHNSIKNV